MFPATVESLPLLRMKISPCLYKFEVNCPKDFPVDQYIAYPSFDYQGYEWAIHYYPHYKTKCSLLISLVLLSKAKGVCAKFFFRLVNKKETDMVTLHSSFHTFNCDGDQYGTEINRNEVKNFIGKDGIFTIICNIEVLSGRRSAANIISSGGLQEHIEKLLNKSDKFDVTFEVDGEKISAHRLILAARSPVFEAELFGSMGEANMKCIKIEDMKADIFRAMINFMYTDQIPSAGSNNLSLESIELVRNLFVAADRYAVEKLMEICEVILCDNLSIETVSANLFLADRHSSPLLNDKCLQFASKPEIFKQLSTMEEYRHLIQTCPFLHVELQKKVQHLSVIEEEKEAKNVVFHRRFDAFTHYRASSFEFFRPEI